MTIRRGARIAALTERAADVCAAIDAQLAAAAEEERAAGAKRYLKSDLAFYGVTAAVLRQAVKSTLPTSPRLSTEERTAVVEGLWSAEVYELKAAAVEVLVTELRRLGPADLPLAEKLLRSSGTWALVDGLAAWVAGDLIARFPELADTLDHWAADEDFWMRRAALLALLVPLRRGGGDFERFARYADAMLSEREFFIRKAIGWVLREVGKRRPELVESFLAPRLDRASGLTVREAVRHLPAATRERVLFARALART